MQNNTGGDFVQDLLDEYAEDCGKILKIDVGHVRTNIDKVVVSNSLVKSGYRLSLIEKRLLLLFVARIDNRITYKEEPNPETGKKEVSLVRSEVAGIELSPSHYYAINVDEYSNVYNVTRESARILLSQSVKELFNNKIVFFNPELTMYSHWIDSIVVYNKGTDEVLIKWNANILPFLTNLHNNFTTYKIAVLRRLTSTYSLRFYEIFLMELVKTRKTKHDLYISLENLHFMLQFKGKKPSTGSLMHDIIKPALQEISSCTDLDITLERMERIGRTERNVLGYVKQGKKVVGITFGIRRRSMKELEKIEKEEEKITRNLEAVHNKRVRLNDGKPLVIRSYMEKCAEVTRITPASEE